MKGERKCRGFGTRDDRRRTKGAKEVESCMRLGAQNCLHGDKRLGLRMEEKVVGMWEEMLTLVDCPRRLSTLYIK